MSAPLLPVSEGMRSSDTFSNISVEELKGNLTQGWNEVKWEQKTVMKSWNENQQTKLQAGKESVPRATKYLYASVET